MLDALTCVLAVHGEGFVVERSPVCSTSHGCANAAMVLSARLAEGIAVEHIVTVGVASPLRMMSAVCG